MKYSAIRLLVGLAAAAPLALVISSCGGASLVPCSNDGECEKAGSNYSYCSRRHCVECVTSASCGDGNTCVDGTCERHCKDDRGCRDNEHCNSGICHD